MTVERKTALRVLYTINSSPQYILARSHSRVQISLITSNEDSSTAGPSNAQKASPALYASVPLKTCLDTICRSSPELTHDTTRDFSLYVLDPLESNSAPAPVHINNANGESSSSHVSRPAAEQPRGVAVGLGLMSWALSADDGDAMSVVGTLIKQSNGQEALEVIFALRETMAMQRPAWSMPPPALPSSSQDRRSSPTDHSSTRQDSKYQPWYSNQSLTSSSSNRPSASKDLTRETLASIQMRAKLKTKPPKPARQSTVPVTESDKLMSADTFIGPMKKKGRPKTTNTDVKPLNIYGNSVASSSSFTSSPNEVIVIDGSDSDGNGTTPTSSAFQIPDTKGPLTRSGIQDLTKKRSSHSQNSLAPAFTTEPLVQHVPSSNTADDQPVHVPTQQVQVKAEPQDELSISDILAYCSATSQNATLLAALSAIDSSNPQAKTNPALVVALKQLLTAYVNAPPGPANTPATPPTPPSSQPQPQQHTPPASQDDLVIFDKENVNPKVQRKVSGKDVAIKVSDSPVSTSNIQVNAVAGPSSHSERALQSLGPNARLNEHILPRTSLKESVLSSRSDKVVRKRTLSDFMDEKEYSRNKSKGKERERVEKRDGHRHASAHRPPANDALRHYPRLLASAQPRPETSSNNYYRTPLESMTSPARSRSESVEELPRHHHTVLSQPPSRPPSPKVRISASSPVRGINRDKKRYVLPEWARTGTSTQPRLSEEAQRALEELEEKKRLERAAARKRLPSMQARSKNKNARSSSSKSDGGDVSGENEPVRQLLKPPAPVAAAIICSDRPLIAASNITFPFMLTRSSSPPPNPAGVPRTPKTPVRDRHHMRPTPGQENESLFTPIMRSGSLFGSAGSRSLHTPLQSVLTSPLGNRKKAKISPSRSVMLGRTQSTSIPWKLSSAQSSEDSKAPEEDEADSLEQELEKAMEDLDCPPSSLPIASSDIDIEEQHTSNDPDATIGDEGIDISPVKQHWQGLPPSSPPPPSSPMLLPEPCTDDDEEMEELPVATSDSEADMDTTPCDSDATAESPAPEFDEQYAGALATNNFAAFFPASDAGSVGSSSIMDIFDQFTHLNSDPTDTDGPMPSMGAASTDSELEAMFQNGLEGIDFTEFWETFKPMVNDSAQFADQDHADAGNGGMFDMSKADGDYSQFADIDHVKLADDMQALLSGCLM